MPTAITFGSVAARAFGFLGRVLRKDAFFNYVTMLLPGNGTNGAQNNTFLDSSTNNFTITRNGNTTQGTFTPYGPNWSNYFDGSGDYLSVANNTAFNFGTGNFTIEGWVYIAANSSANASSNRVANIASTLRATSPSGFEFAIDGNTTTTGTGIYFNNWVSGTSYTISAATTITQGVWNHLAVVRNGTTTTIYVNGTSVASGTLGNQTISPIDDLWIAANNNSNYLHYLNGYISNFRILKGTALYTANFTPPTGPLTAITNTSLLTCQSNRFIDNSSNNFTITKNGDTSVQRFSPFSPTASYSAATNGGSGYFPNVLTTGNNVTYSNYLTLTDAGVNLSGTSYTMEAWVYPLQAASGSPPQENLWVFDWYSAYNNRWGLTFNTTKIELYSDGPSISLQGSGAVPVNAWTHLAASWDGTTTRLFINGALVASSSTNYARNLSTINIGRGRYSFSTITDLGALPGYMAGARIVKGTAVYTAAFTPPTAPPTAVTNTALLLNYTNGGIIDNAMMNDLETVGNAQISTTQSKFGGSSMYFDGTGDQLTVPSSVNFDLGTVYTYEFWVYPNSIASNFGIVLRGSYNAGSNTWSGLVFSARWLTGSPNVLRIYLYGTTNANEQNIDVNNALAANTWTHVAVVRNGTTAAVYINGVSSGTASGLNTPAVSTQPLLVGNWSYSAGNEYLNGYIDDLRITKGVARYTANFTPPTAAFPTQ